MFLKEITDQLKEHAARFDLENRAIESCKKTLRNLLAEDPEETRFYLRGLAVEDLKYQLVKHELVFESPNTQAHILSRVICGPHSDFWVFDIEPWGNYNLETIENGEVSDDWFSWEQMRDEEGKLTEFSRV